MQLCSGCGICVPSLWGGCCCHCPLDVAISCACRTLQGALREGSVQRGRVQASLHSVQAEMCAGISQSSSQLLITLQMIVWDTLSCISRRGSCQLDVFGPERKDGTVRKLHFVCGSSRHLSCRRLRVCKEQSSACITPKVPSLPPCRVFGVPEQPVPPRASQGAPAGWGAHPGTQGEAGSAHTEMCSFEEGAEVSQAWLVCFPVFVLECVLLKLR